MRYETTDNVHLRSAPSTSGTILRTIPAGTTLESDGKSPWASVTLPDGATRFCASQYLRVLSSDTITHKLPFHVGVANVASDATTVAVRAAIGDCFGDGKSGIELQCTEYVQYRVKEKLGIDIKWPVTSGRNGGVWWKIFQNAGEYSISLEPKANAAMCFTAGISADPAICAIGHVAFVEALLQDNSILISEANWPHDGIYNERTLIEVQWKDKYQARFVAFT